MYSQNIIYIIYNFLFFMFLIIINIFSSDSMSYISLCFLYCFIYLSIFFNPHNTPIAMLFFLGLIIDAINDIFFGLSSTMFISIFLLIKNQLKYFKNIDFVNTYIIFIINVAFFSTIITIGVLILSFEKFMIPIKVGITSILLFPITYYLTLLYKYIYNRNENTIKN